METVFGLDVEPEVPIAFLEGSPAKPTGRGLAVSVRTGDATELGWPESAELICDERDRDGSVVFQIEADPGAGYLISGPGHGAHKLSADGEELRCAPQGCPDDAWQRLLIAQVLPFAALLHGLEVFHASAVVRNGEAIAILGPSGAGKTSVALAQCRLGAEFFADDVLALETRDEGLLAHPGARLVGLDHAEARRLEEAGKAQPEEVVAVNERERLLRMRGAVEPVPLGALFFLDRRPDGPPTPRFEPIWGAQPLLGATFNFVLSTPERLCGLLEVCSLAAQLRVEQIVTGPEVDATMLAGEIGRRMDASS